MAFVNFAARTRRIISRSDSTERVSAAQTSVAKLLAATKDSQRGCVSQAICAAGKVSRSAAMAGKVCTISPKEPNRTTRNRGSGIGPLANAVEQRARGMVLRIPNDSHANSQTRGSSALRHGLAGVICALGVHVWPQFFQKTFYVWFAEEHHEIDGIDRGHQLGTSVFIKDWPICALERTYAGIRIYCGHQHVSLFARRLE